MQQYGGSSPGRTYVLKKASTNTTSLTTFTTPTGPAAKHTVTMYNKAFDTGKLVLRRIKRGRGRDGVVMTMEGMVRAKVKALRRPSAIRKLGVGRRDGAGETCCACS